MPRHLFIIFLLLSGTACVADSLFLTPNDLLSWPRMNAQTYGCVLERKTGYTDKHFNCSKQSYKPDWGSPCNPTESSYTGPQLPEYIVSKLHPSITKVQIDWDFGRIQSVIIQFKKKISNQELEVIFPDLKQQAPFLQSNLMDVSLQQCSKNASCLVLQGFEHIGATEADCADESTLE